MSELMPKSFELTFLFALSFVLVAYFIFNYVSHNLSRRLGAQYGCQPILSVHPSRWLGVNFIFDTHKHYKERNYLHALCRQFEDVGSTHEVRMLGYNLGHRLDVMKNFLGRGAFVTDVEEWQHSRALLRPSFNRGQVANLDTIEDHVSQLLRLIPSGGETVDLQELFYRFTMDSPTGEFARSFKYALHRVSEGMRLGPMHSFRKTDPKAEEANRFWRNYVSKYVDQTLAYRKKLADQGELGGRERRTFLMGLVMATDDREKMCDELISLLLAGRDTTASLIGSVIFCLSQNAYQWKKVRNEVQKVFGDRVPTYEELRSLQYVKHCINESLRLFPPVPNNAKMATEDTVLPHGGDNGGKAPVLVPKGCIIIYTVFALHRRKDLWGDDADDFRPERWEMGRKFAWDFLPFNAGPRICLGQQYALTEAMYILIRMAQGFQTIESRDEEPWVESLELTVSSGNGVKVAVQRAKTGST
ncbi:related to cytochrome P450 alkane hydroxylase [Fusarium torulosum]|uniref:Related to cytochrome P450 alkane hydroxylase n=1 Tax=Fusarium torulosum TaxID=33205 RepID=A0AAE8SND5_9HYPO|nr:related to cytochrome P450 alkane hydroxylase [Fusarium torulosum]